jgi:cyclopropane-fatty-acyl-phospholipid synthase
MFAREPESLEEASQRKLECVAAKLELRDSDRVLEIGTGWGGFALHAAATRGCHVTTVTISREQHALACERVRVAGLQDRVDVQLCDYRDVRGEFDKVVSIEMIEAIGAAQLETYFSTLGRCLRPGGRALVQAITIEDHRYARALRSVDFIKRHVFPGSFIPSINAMIAAKSRASTLRLVHLEDFADSYARTLHEWRSRFHAVLPAVRAQGFEERFIRLWDFYLAYCEAAFCERATGVSHLLFEQPAILRPHTHGAG